MEYKDLYEAIEAAPELTIIEESKDIQAIYTKLKGLIVSFSLQSGIVRGAIWGTDKHFRFQKASDLDTLLQQLGVRKGGKA